MVFNIKQLKELSKEQVRAYVWAFWRRAFPYVVFTMFLSGATWIGYTWYKNIYDIEITKTERDEYVAQRQKEVELREESFKKMRDTVAERKKRFEEGVSSTQDIFFPYGVEVEE